MERKIRIVGIGPGDVDYIHPAARKYIEECDVLVGGKRNLELFSHLGKEQVAVGNNLDEVYGYIGEQLGEKRITVLVTGDPGLYSMLSYLKERLQADEIEVVPGISALQYLCARFGLTWNDMYITSVHGREQEKLVEIIKQNRKVALFAGGGNRPDHICRQLMEQGLEGLEVMVGENLSYPKERLVKGSLEEVSKMAFDSLAIMVLMHTEDFRHGKEAWEYATPGLPDEMFLRGEVPMTKAEVRAVSVAKLRLTGKELVCDIGAGTGSVTVECGLLCRSGRVIALERNPDAVELIHQNIRKFGLTNVEVVQGASPQALKELPPPDRVFIGGTGGSMDEVFEWICSSEKAVRVVVNAVTLESAYEAIDSMGKRGFGDVEIVHIGVSRGRSVGGKHLMQALNPVYIISGEKT